MILSSYSDNSSRTVQPPSRPTLCSRKRSQGRRSRTFSMAGSCGGGGPWVRSQLRAPAQLPPTAVPSRTPR